MIFYSGTVLTILLFRFRFFYLLSQCETTRGREVLQEWYSASLPSESRVGEVLKTLILAVPGISVSMIFVETIKKMGENEYPILWFVYYCNTKHMPIMSMMTVRIASPFMFTLISLEVVMHIFIQVLARKLDGSRGTIIMIENQIVTRRMHRRLVISETGYFMSAFFRFLVAVTFVYVISPVDKLSYQKIGQLFLFCGPSLFFFVIPLILTVSSPEVCSSLSQCLKYFRQEMR